RRSRGRRAQQRRRLSPEADEAIPGNLLNRVPPVTDKGCAAWQKRTARAKSAASRSVCRELPRMALAAQEGQMYRLRLLRAGIRVDQEAGAFAQAMKPILI